MCYRQVVPAAPPITFAIPFRSDRAYLRRAIESLLAQRDDNWVAFVSDNASTEPDLEDAVRTWGRGRVGYSRTAENLGMAGNFNRCLDLAETDLVTLLHADDELEPSYCETMRDAAARHPDAAALYCSATIIDAESRAVFSVPDFVKGFLDPAHHGETVLHGEPGVRALVTGNFILAPTLCFRRSVLGPRRWPSAFRFVLDWELTSQLLLDGDALVGLPQRCMRVRRHDVSTTEALSREYARFSEESAFYDRARAIARDRGWARCERVAARKSLYKLNLGYRTVKNLALGQLDDAYKTLTLLRGAWQ